MDKNKNIDEIVKKIQEELGEVNDVKKGEKSGKIGALITLPKKAKKHTNNTDNVIDANTANNITNTNVIEYVKLEDSMMDKLRENKSRMQREAIAKENELKKSIAKAKKQQDMISILISLLFNK